MSDDVEYTDKVRRFPRTPRFTTQDHEDANDARRYVVLNNSVKHLGQMHSDLHGLFGEVIKVDGEWPFFSVRQLQAYVEHSEFTLLTKAEQVLHAAIDAARHEIRTRADALTRALMGRSGETLNGTCGFDMQKDARLLKGLEHMLRDVADVVEEADTTTQDAIARSLKVTRHGLRSMYNHGGLLPEIGRKAIETVAATPQVAREDEIDPTYLPQRRKELRLAEHWVGLSNAQINLMKLMLLKDYSSASKGDQGRSEARFDGGIFMATLAQQNFIKADAQALTDLSRANSTLYQALIH